MKIEEESSFFPDISVITDDKSRSGDTGPSPRNTSASCISTITFDESESGESTYHHLRRPGGCSSNTHCHKDSNFKHERMVQSFRGDQSMAFQSQTSYPLNQIQSNMADRMIGAHYTSSTHSFGKGSSLYSRILSGLQEMGINEVKDEETKNNNYETTMEGTLETDSSDKTMSKDNHLDTPSRGNKSTDDDVEEEDSITEEIEEVEDEECDDMFSEDCNHRTNSSYFNDVSVHHHSSTINYPEQKEAYDEEGRQEKDQWREVYDDRTGRSYYYNRRTRESSWILPSNGIVVGRKLQVCSTTARSSMSRSGNRSTTCSSIRDVSMCEVMASQEEEQEEAEEETTTCTPEGHDAGTCDTHSIFTGMEENAQQDDCDDDDDDDEEEAGCSKQLFFQPTTKLGLCHTSEPEHYHDATSSNKNKSSTTVEKQEHQQPHLNCYTSPSTTRTKTLCFYCMYCGIEVATANAMKQHLHLNCFEYSYFIRNNKNHPHPMNEEHVRLQQILRNAWDCAPEEHDHYVKESNKENQDPSAAALSLLQQKLQSPAAAAALQKKKTDDVNTNRNEAHVPTTPPKFVSQKSTLDAEQYPTIQEGEKEDQQEEASATRTSTNKHMKNHHHTNNVSMISASTSTTTTTDNSATAADQTTSTTTSLDIWSTATTHTSTPIATAPTAAAAAAAAAADRSVFTLSDDEDTILDFDLRPRGRSNNWYPKNDIQKSNNKKNRNDNNISTATVTTPEQQQQQMLLYPSYYSYSSSSCAFCGKSFRTGDKLSRHFLICKERQKSNQKRARNKNASAVRYRGAATTTTAPAQDGMLMTPSPSSVKKSIQAHLLTTSGRHLPGYPPVRN